MRYYTISILIYIIRHGYCNYNHLHPGSSAFRELEQLAWNLRLPVSCFRIVPFKRLVLPVSSFPIYIYFLGFAFSSGPTNIFLLNKHFSAWKDDWWRFMQIFQFTLLFMQIFRKVPRQFWSLQFQGDVF